MPRRFDELHGYIGAIPGILLSSIHNALMQNFTKRFFKVILLDFNIFFVDLDNFFDLDHLLFDLDYF